LAEYPTTPSDADAGSETGLARLRRLLALLIEAAADLPGDSSAGPLAADPDFARRRSEIEVALLGIEALLQRGSPLLDRVAACRTGAAEAELAALADDVFGYYALPDPDPLLIDNEGPIGHHHALGVMRSLAARFGGAVRAPGGHETEHRNEIANRLLAK
jgi:hypothetical protein